MRRPVRVAFGVALLIAVVGGGLAVSAFLRPPSPPAEIAVGRVDEVSEVPVRIRLAQLDQLGALARLRRSSVPTGGSGRQDPHGIYLVRDDDGAIRAYLAADPRNGCALDWIDVQMASGPLRAVYASRFFDTCHGSQYDRNGTVVGGPSPWALDEAVVTVRNGTVYARTDEVRPGRWLAR